MVRTLITGLQKTSQQYIRFAFSEKATGLCSGISPATSVSSQAVFNGTSLHNIRDGIQYYPLINNTGDNKWEERTGCTFTAQAYHVSIDSQDINPCFLQGITFSNFVFEVRMTIIAGNTGGILFRDSGGNGKGLFYYLSIDTNGLYYLSFYVDRQSSNFHNLINGTASAFRTGLGQTNIIAMVANGSTFDLYVNQQYLDSVSGNSSEQGSIALVADGVSEVVYSEAKVWIL